MLKKILRFIFIDTVLKQDAEILRKLPLFAGLSDRALAKIALIVFKKDYLEGETLLAPGQEAEIIFIVRGGLIRINDGQNEKIAGENEMFGEKCLVDSSKNRSDAKALKNSSLFLIYKVRLNDLMHSDSKAGFTIMKNLASSFCQTQNKNG